jgi:hypothetical protein
MKENPNKVPLNFFESQRADILSEVSKYSNKRTSIYSLRNVGIISIAASLTIFVWFLSPWVSDNGIPCVSYSCLLESTELNDLTESEELLIEEWEEEEMEEEFGIYQF